MKQGGKVYSDKQIRAHVGIQPSLIRPAEPIKNWEKTRFANEIIDRKRTGNRLKNEEYFETQIGKVKPFNYF
jgi:hypothetical protein